MTTFHSLGASDVVTRALAERGITEPFAVQELVVPDALAGRDVLARSRTGSGKTLAFALPIVERLASTPGTAKPTALILVPTRELAAQVVREFDDLARAKSLRVAAAYGGITIREQSSGVTKADILVATPGRLEDLANRRMVKLDGVRILVLDEADRMLDMGFAPQVEAIARRVPRDRQTMLFSATLDGDVARLAARYTREPIRHEVAAPRVTVDEAEHRRPGRPPTSRARARARVRPHQARGGPAGLQARHARHQGGGDARRPDTGSARTDARAVHVREGLHARRHRRRRARTGRPGHRPRHQL